MCKIKNKRRKILSTSTDKENFDANEMLSSLSWLKNNFEPIIHTFNNQNSGVKGNLTPESTPLDAFQLFFFLEELLLSYYTGDKQLFYICERKYFT